MGDINFKCTIKSKYFGNSGEFSIYSVDVDKSQYPTIKKGVRGEYIITGELPALMPNNEYYITAEEDRNPQYGYQYKVKNIRMDKPNTYSASLNFLKECTSEERAKSLLSVYPDIIDMISKNKDKNIDLSKVKNVGQKTYEDIRGKVLKSIGLLDLVDLFDGALTPKQLQKLHDKYTSVSVVKKKLKEDPYKCMCNLSRIGFKLADSILLNIQKSGNTKIEFEEDLLTSKQRMRACLEFILDENESTGNTKMFIKDLRIKCNELTPECINHFVDCVTEENNNIHVDDNTKSMSTKRAYNTEKYIAEKIDDFLSLSFVWNIEPEIYRKVGEFPLTDEQMQTLTNICNSQLSILTAGAGSGKSASVNNLVKMLKDNKKSFMLCSPTAKAAKVLAEFTGEDAGTIHRKLEYNPANDGSPWGYNAENKLDVDVVIVDEFSMVDIYLFKNLLDAIDPSNTKLLLVFDPFQLASVGCGNLAHDLLNAEIIPTTKLTKTFRFNDGGLMTVATKIRNSESFIDNGFMGNKVFGEKRDFIYNEMQQEKMKDLAIKIYSKLLNDGYTIEDIAVIVCQNKGDYGTYEINKEVQRLIQKGKNNNFCMRGKDKFFVDDKVMHTVNNYKAVGVDGSKESVFNGNTGIVVSANKDSMIVDFDGVKILYTGEDLKKIELGYCITAHKSQGSSVKQAIVIAPKAHTFMMNSNLLYVAATRSRERVYMLGNIATINRAIKKKENFNRQTYMGSMLEVLK